MSTPDVTRAQLLAICNAVVATVVAFGVSLTSAQQIALMTLAGAVSAALVASDAAIRRGRAQHLAGPLADQAAAAEIRQAATATRSSSSADLLASEAEAERAAQQANEAGAALDQPPDGIDRATLG